MRSVSPARQKLGQTLSQTIEAIAAMVEARDPYTAGHQRRVAALASAIAGEMGFAEDRIHGLYLAATIHDLGKIHIPAEILSKPGYLSQIEFSLIKVHPQAGYDIIKDIQFPWNIAQMVLQHHERLDGSGYPQGLHGGQILIEAQILCCVRCGGGDVIASALSPQPGVGCGAGRNYTQQRHSFRCCGRGGLFKVVSGAGLQTFQVEPVGFCGV